MPRNSKSNRSHTSRRHPSLRRETSSPETQQKEEAEEEPLPKQAPVASVTIKTYEDLNRKEDSSCQKELTTSKSYSPKISPSSIPNPNPSVTEAKQLESVHVNIGKYPHSIPGFSAFQPFSMSNVVQPNRSLEQPNVAASKTFQSQSTCVHNSTNPSSDSSTEVPTVIDPLTESIPLTLPSSMPQNMHFSSTQTAISTTSITTLSTTTTVTTTTPITTFASSIKLLPQISSSSKVALRSESTRQSILNMPSNPTASSQSAMEHKPLGHSVLSMISTLSTPLIQEMNQSAVSLYAIPSELSVSVEQSMPSKTLLSSDQCLQTLPSAMPNVSLKYSNSSNLTIPSESSEQQKLLEQSMIIIPKTSTEPTMPVQVSSKNNKLKEHMSNKLEDLAPLDQSTSSISITPLEISMQLNQMEQSSERKLIPSPKYDQSSSLIEKSMESTTMITKESIEKMSSPKSQSSISSLTEKSSISVISTVQALHEIPLGQTLPVISTSRVESLLTIPKEKSTCWNGLDKNKLSTITIPLERSNQSMSTVQLNSSMQPEEYPNLSVPIKSSLNKTQFLPLQPASKSTTDKYKQPIQLRRSVMLKSKLSLKPVMPLDHSMSTSTSLLHSADQELSLEKPTSNSPLHSIMRRNSTEQTNMAHDISTTQSNYSLRKNSLEQSTINIQLELPMKRMSLESSPSTTASDLLVQQKPLKHLAEKQFSPRHTVILQRPESPLPVTSLRHSVSTMSSDSTIERMTSFHFRSTFPSKPLIEPVKQISLEQWPITVSDSSIQRISEKHYIPVNTAESSIKHKPLIQSILLMPTENSSSILPSDSSIQEPESSIPELSIKGSSDSCTLSTTSDISIKTKASDIMSTGPPESPKKQILLQHPLKLSKSYLEQMLLQQSTSILPFVSPTSKNTELVGKPNSISPKTLERPIIIENLCKVTDSSLQQVPMEQPTLIISGGTLKRRMSLEQSMSTSLSENSMQRIPLGQCSPNLPSLAKRRMSLDQSMESVGLSSSVSNLQSKQLEDAETKTSLESSIKQMPLPNLVTIRTSVLSTKCKILGHSKPQISSELSLENTPLNQPKLIKLSESSLQYKPIEQFISKITSESSVQRVPLEQSKISLLSESSLHPVEQSPSKMSPTSNTRRISLEQAMSITEEVDKKKESTIQGLPLELSDSSVLSKLSLNESPLENPDSKIPLETTLQQMPVEQKYIIVSEASMPLAQSSPFKQTVSSTALISQNQIMQSQFLATISTISSESTISSLPSMKQAIPFMHQMPPNASILQLKSMVSLPREQYLQSITGTQPSSPLKQIPNNQSVSLATTMPLGQSMPSMHLAQTNQMPLDPSIPSLTSIPYGQYTASVSPMQTSMQQMAGNPLNAPSTRMPAVQHMPLYTHEIDYAVPSIPHMLSDPTSGYYMYSMQPMPFVQTAPQRSTMSPNPPMASLQYIQLIQSGPHLSKMSSVQSTASMQFSGSVPQNISAPSMAAMSQMSLVQSLPQTLVMSSDPSVVSMHQVQPLSPALNIPPQNSIIPTSLCHEETMPRPLPTSSQSSNQQLQFIQPLLSTQTEPSLLPNVPATASASPIIPNQPTSSEDCTSQQSQLDASDDLNQSKLLMPNFQPVSMLSSGSCKPVVCKELSVHQMPSLSITPLTKRPSDEIKIQNKDTDNRVENQFPLETSKYVPDLQRHLTHEQPEMTNTQNLLLESSIASGSVPCETKRKPQERFSLKTSIPISKINLTCITNLPDPTFTGSSATQKSIYNSYFTSSMADNISRAEIQKDSDLQSAQVDTEDVESQPSSSRLTPLKTTLEIRKPNLKANISKETKSFSSLACDGSLKEHENQIVIPNTDSIDKKIPLNLQSNNPQLILQGTNGDPDMQTKKIYKRDSILVEEITPSKATFLKCLDQDNYDQDDFESLITENRIFGDKIVVKEKMQGTSQEQMLKIKKLIHSEKNIVYFAKPSNLIMTKNKSVVTSDKQSKKTIKSQSSDIHMTKSSNNKLHETLNKPTKEEEKDKMENSLIESTKLTNVIKDKYKIIEEKNKENLCLNSVNQVETNPQANNDIEDIKSNISQEPEVSCLDVYEMRKKMRRLNLLNQARDVQKPETKKLLDIDRYTITPAKMNAEIYKEFYKAKLDSSNGTNNSESDYEDDELKEYETILKTYGATNNINDSDKTEFLSNFMLGTPKACEDMLWDKKERVLHRDRIASAYVAAGRLDQLTTDEAPQEPPPSLSETETETVNVETISHDELNKNDVGFKTKQTFLLQLNMMHVSPRARDDYEKKWKEIIKERKRRNTQPSNHASKQPKLSDDNTEINTNSQLQMLTEIKNSVTENNNLIKKRLNQSCENKGDSIKTLAEKNISALDRLSKMAGSSLKIIRNKNGENKKTNEQHSDSVNAKNPTSNPDPSKVNLSVYPNINIPKIPKIILPKIISLKTKSEPSMVTTTQATSMDEPQNSAAGVEEMFNGAKRFKQSSCQTDKPLWPGAEEMIRMYADYDRQRRMEILELHRQNTALRVEGAHITRSASRDSDKARALLAERRNLSTEEAAVKKAIQRLFNAIDVVRNYF